MSSSSSCRSSNSSFNVSPSTSRDNCVERCGTTTTSKLLYSMMTNKTACIKFRLNGGGGGGALQPLAHNNFIPIIKKGRSMKWHGQVTRSHGHAKTIMQEIILVVRDMCKINATSTHTRSFGPFYNDVDDCWLALSNAVHRCCHVIRNTLIFYSLVIHDTYLQSNMHA